MSGRMRGARTGIWESVRSRDSSLSTRTEPCTANSESPFRACKYHEHLNKKITEYLPPTPELQQMQMQTGDDDTNNTGGGGDDGPLNFGREEIDQTYIVLKQASEMAISSSNVSNRRIQQQQQQQTLSSSLDQPPQQNISASDQSLVSSTGAINRTSNVMRITTSSTQLQQQQQPTGSSMSSSSRRANPNSLSVGDPSSSFLSSSSGKYVHSCENALIFSRPIVSN